MERTVWVKELLPGVYTSTSRPLLASSTSFVNSSARLDGWSLGLCLVKSGEVSDKVAEEVVFEELARDAM